MFCFKIGSAMQHSLALTLTFQPQHPKIWDYRHVAFSHGSVSNIRLIKDKLFTYDFSSPLYFFFIHVIFSYLSHLERVQFTNESKEEKNSQFGLTYHKIRQLPALAKIGSSDFMSLYFLPSSQYKKNHHSSPLYARRNLLWP